MVDTFDCTNIEIKEGDVGAEVTLLQTHLKALGYYTYYNGSYLKIDGIFGTYTAWALKKFQKDTGHSQDAVFGPKTCPDLNKKILAKYGITATDTVTPSTGGTASTTSTGTANTTSAKSKYAINTGKNVFRASESNINIAGLYFIASKLKRTNELRTPDWKTIQLMDGSDYDYLGEENCLQYQFEVLLDTKDYNTIRGELEKLGYQPRQVATTLFPSGVYTVKVAPDDNNVGEVKLTVDLKEYQA